MVNVKIGTFSGNASTGNQAVTGVGFQPSAIIIFRAQPTTGVTTSASLMIGAGSGPWNQFVCGYRAEDALADSDTRRYFKSDKIIFVNNASASTTFAEADLTSLDSDGFTINWTTAGAGQSYIYIAFSEDADVHVGTFDLNASTGNQSITGTGFQPKAVMFFNTRSDAADGVQDNASLSMGAASSASARWAHSGIDLDAQATTDSARNGSNSLCIQRTSTAAVVAAADLVSMDGNGFTINVSTAAATRWGYIAIGGTDVQAKAGAFQARTTTGSRAYTGVGFQADIIIMGGEGKSLGTSHVAAFGAGVSSSSRAYVASNSADAGVTSNTARAQKTDRCIGFPNAGGAAVDIEADLTSLDSDGFTLNWGTVDGVAREFSYLALKIPDPVGAAAGGSGWMWIG